MKEKLQESAFQTFRQCAVSREAGATSEKRPLGTLSATEAVFRLDAEEMAKKMRIGHACRPS